MSEKLTKAMNDALVINPDVAAWTQEDVIKWFDLDSVDGSTLGNICSQLVTIASMIPQETKDTVIQNFQDSIPTVEEIMEAVDFTSMSWREYGKLIGGDRTIDTFPIFNFSIYDDSLLTGQEEDFEKRCRTFSEQIRSSFENNMNPEDIINFMNAYMSEAYSGIDFVGPFSNEYYAQMQVMDFAESLGILNVNFTTQKGTLDFTAAGSKFGAEVGNSILNTDMEPINSAISTLKGNTGTAINMAFAPGFNTTTPVLITANYKLVNPTATISFSGGGSGTATVNASVAANADGNMFDDVPLNNPVVVSYGNEDSGKTEITVQVQLSPNFKITGSDGNEENIVRILKSHIKELADELGGELTEKLEKVFSNMPVIREEESICRKFL